MKLEGYPEPCLPLKSSEKLIVHKNKQQEMIAVKSFSYKRKKKSKVRVLIDNERMPERHVTKQMKTVILYFQRS